MPTRVARYIQDHGASVWLRTVEGTYKAISAFLTAIGLTVVAWAAFFDMPSPLQGTAQGSMPRSSLSAQWHTIILLAVGLSVALVAAVGFIAASNQSIWLLNMHLVLLSMLLAAQLCLGVTVISSAHDPGQELATPTTSSVTINQENEQKPLLHATWEVDGTSRMWTSVADTQRVELVVASVGVGLQVLVLMVGCMLQSIYTQLDEAAQDAAEEAQTTTILRQPLLPGSSSSRPHRPRGAPEDPAAAEWRTRMQERYGLDTTAFSYDPSGAVRQEPAPHLEPFPRENRCSIM